MKRHHANNQVSEVLAEQLRDNFGRINGKKLSRLLERYFCKKMHDKMESNLLIFAYDRERRSFRITDIFGGTDETVGEDVFFTFIREEY